MKGEIPIKTPEQIEFMRHGGLILKETLKIASEAVKPGISTLELDELAENYIRSKGAEPGFKGYRSFPATLCTSVNEQVVHGIPSKDTILKDGDIIGIDCGVLYKGFYTDACLTVLVGDVDPEIKYFVKITKKALAIAIKQVRPNGHVGDISFAIQKAIESYGYSAVVECTGHGVGKNLHEPPTILNVGEKGTKEIMQPGMTFAIEPISAMGNGDVITAEDGWTVVTKDRSVSAHFEHTILVTDSGYEILT